ncbi:hypothetical protein HK105_207810 [Polyrhizophydium stewartii]|uniref:ABC transmembrane type-1 domain-containing protein n=1 Tax=Polyrhizophydium stewartii TaxID=2732419 RepID=A0ABR4MZJ1_9FUNG
MLAINLIQPIIIQQIQQFLNRAPDGPKLLIDSGIGLALLLFGSQVVHSIASSTYIFVVLFSKARLRAALVGAAYAKSMRLSPKAQSTFSAGKINSFVVSDVDTICDFR